MPVIRIPKPLKCLCALLLLAMPNGLPAQAAPPEISNVFPDFPTEYPNASPHLVTGEGFEPGKTEVWVWSPGKEAAAITNALAGLGEAEPILPEQPPQDARRVSTLDVERQVLVAALEGVVVWVKTTAGVSKPCLFNVPKPCWLGPERAEPGASVHVFGFGLRAPWQAPRLALKGAEGHYLLSANPPSRDYRAEDSTLLCFDVPENALPGRYDVFVHNGNGGALGWCKAGLLEIIAPVKIPEKLFNVHDYGAKGDDEENDYAAIVDAMAAAKSAANNTNVRAVVAFPPGKFRTDTTLEVPSGVTLRGASRDLSVIEGFGVLPPDRHTTALVGEELRAETTSGRLQITGSLPARGIGCVLAGRPTQLGGDFGAFLKRQHQTHGHSDFNAATPYRETRLLAVAPSARSKQVPAGMVEVPPATLELAIEMRQRECGFYEPSPPRGKGFADSYDFNTATFRRRVEFKRFAIGLTPVTNAEFARFLSMAQWKPRHAENFLKHWPGGKPPDGQEDHPVVYVDLDDARAYARWAGQRLPTEEEWQYAAQGADGRAYPWGNEMEPGRCNDGKSGGSTAVSAFPLGRSPFGCHDMCGNVWQWTESERSDGRTRFCIIRGGSFFAARGSNWYVDGGPRPANFATKFLLMWPGLDRCATIGFRCVKDIG